MLGMLLVAPHSNSRPSSGQVPGVSVLRFHEPGIHTPIDLFSRASMNIRSWEDLQVQYRLTWLDKQTFDIVLSALPVEMVHKLGIHFVRPW